MKKITMLALLCAMFVAPSVNAQEVTTKEDPSQGYLLNDFKDNWFISVEAGGNLMLSKHDTQESLLKRIQPSVEIYAGKWFSPVFGVRGGLFGARTKGATFAGEFGDRGGMACENNAYNHQIIYKVGGAFDVMLNLTNWWCGYKADRLYNASFYAGAVVNVPFLHNGGSDFDWYKAKSNFGVRAGILNTFAVSKKVDLLVDARFGCNQTEYENKKVSFEADLLIGAAYKFGKSEWNAPIVPVCPTYKYTDAEGDALVARLQQADAKIASLEQQLRDCLNSKQTAVVEEAPAAPLATIYFPIGSASVNNVQAKVVKAVANAMKNTEDKYVLTGWADNYTGSEAVNKKLRAKRAASVKKMIVKTGVAADRLETTTNDNNLTEYGEKSASLDRAVTITVAE